MPQGAYEKIRLGASLVQVLTALIYEGPGSCDGSRVTSPASWSATASGMSARPSGWMQLERAARHVVALQQMTRIAWKAV